jgi:hypothetical protein
MTMNKDIRSSTLHWQHVWKLGVVIVHAERQVESTRVQLELEGAVVTQINRDGERVGRAGLSCITPGENIVQRDTSWVQDNAYSVVRLLETPSEARSPTFKF